MTVDAFMAFVRDHGLTVERIPIRSLRSTRSGSGAPAVGRALNADYKGTSG